VDLSILKKDFKVDLRTIAGDLKESKDSYHGLKIKMDNLNNEYISVKEEIVSGRDRLSIMESSGSDIKELDCTLVILIKDNKVRKEREEKEEREETEKKADREKKEEKVEGNNSAFNARFDSIESLLTHLQSRLDNSENPNPNPSSSNTDIGNTDKSKIDTTLNNRMDSMESRMTLLVSRLVSIDSDGDSNVDNGKSSGVTSHETIISRFDLVESKVINLEKKLNKVSLLLSKEREVVEKNDDYRSIPHASSIPEATNPPSFDPTSSHLKTIDLSILEKTERSNDDNNSDSHDKSPRAQGGPSDLTMGDIYRQSTSGDFEGVLREDQKDSAASIDNNSSSYSSDDDTVEDKNKNGATKSDNNSVDNDDGNSSESGNYGKDSDHEASSNLDADLNSNSSQSKESDTLSSPSSVTNLIAKFETSPSNSSKQSSPRATPLTSPNHTPHQSRHGSLISIGDEKDHIDSEVIGYTDNDGNNDTNFEVNQEIDQRDDKEGLEEDEEFEDEVEKGEREDQRFDEGEGDGGEEDLKDDLLIEVEGDGYNRKDYESDFDYHHLRSVQKQERTSKEFELGPDKNKSEDPLEDSSTFIESNPMLRTKNLPPSSSQRTFPNPSKKIILKSSVVTARRASLNPSPTLSHALSLAALPLPPTISDAPTMLKTFSSPSLLSSSLPSTSSSSSTSLPTSLLESKDNMQDTFKSNTSKFSSFIKNNSTLVDSSSNPSSNPSYTPSPNTSSKNDRLDDNDTTDVNNIVGISSSPDSIEDLEGDKGHHISPNLNSSPRDDKVSNDDSDDKDVNSEIKNSEVKSEFSTIDHDERVAPKSNEITNVSSESNMSKLSSFMKNNGTSTNNVKKQENPSSKPNSYSSPSSESSPKVQSFKDKLSMFEKVNVEPITKTNNVSTSRSLFLINDFSSDEEEESDEKNRNNSSNKITNNSAYSNFINKKTIDSTPTYTNNDAIKTVNAINTSSLNKTITTENAKIEAKTDSQLSQLGYTKSYHSAEDLEKRSERYFQSRLRLTWLKIKL
jgi:hypothetical protein